MMKHIALIGILAFGIAAPIAAAGATNDGAGPPPLQRIMQLARQRIERGVRAGRITPAELARLRTEVTAIRSRIQTIRQSGAAPTPAERQQVRQALRRLNRDIFVANHNRIKR